MTGLSLDKAGGHFILRRQRRDSTRGSISLTPNELLTLAEMAPSLRQQALAIVYSSQDTSSAEAIIATDVFDFQLRLEALETKLLLMVQVGTTGSSTISHALSRELADRLGREIPPILPSAVFLSAKVDRQALGHAVRF
jgi:hypothetical protein